MGALGALGPCFCCYRYLPFVPVQINFSVLLVSFDASCTRPDVLRISRVHRIIRPLHHLHLPPSSPFDLDHGPVCWDEIRPMVGTTAAAARSRVENKATHQAHRNGQRNASAIIDFIMSMEGGEYEYEGEGEECDARLSISRLPSSVSVTRVPETAA